MTTFSLTKDQILKDMESIYQKAFGDGQWRVALRAKELQGKILGFFMVKKPDFMARKPDAPETVALKDKAIEMMKGQPRHERRRRMKELLREATAAAVPQGRKAAAAA